MKSLGLVRVEIDQFVISALPFFVDPHTDKQGEEDEHDLYILGREVFVGHLFTFDLAGRRLRIEPRS